MQKLPLSGGPAVTLASAWSFGIALDATNVYYFDNVSLAVMTVPIAGGAATTLATNGNPGVPDNLAVDAFNVYWTDSFNQVVLKTSKR